MRLLEVLCSFALIAGLAALTAQASAQDPIKAGDSGLKAANAAG